jgi:DNA (cytosine-5)-methyltransferase 1
MSIIGAERLEPLIRPETLAELGIPEDPNMVGLFEGYGGLTEGIRAIVHGNLIAYSEIDPSSIRLLEAHYPGIPNLGDVSHVDWAPWRGRVNILGGGFPCQDVSHAGLGAGIQHGTRSGLWFEFARAIDELRPELVVIENVRGLRSAPAGLKKEITDDELIEDDSDLVADPWDLGGPDGSGRPVLRALGAVLGDLAELGFHAEWDSVRASDVGAPHRRERVFIVAVPKW